MNYFKYRERTHDNKDRLSRRFIESDVMPIYTWHDGIKYESVHGVSCEKCAIRDNPNLCDLDKFQCVQHLPNTNYYYEYNYVVSSCISNFIMLKVNRVKASFRKLYRQLINWIDEKRRY